MTIYSEELGAGFLETDGMRIEEGLYTAPLLHFQTDLPDRDYTITLTSPASANVQEMELTINGVEIQPNWVLEQQEWTCLFPFALVGTALHLHVEGSPAVLSTVEVTPIHERQRGTYPALFLIGDSTVCAYEKERAPMAGWGQMIGRFFQETIHIENRAMGGRSTRSAYREGRLNALLTDIKPGDYVLIQFAHNDETPTKLDRYVTVDQYKTYLRDHYIRGVLQRQGIPVCVTSMNRRTFDKEAGTFIDSFPAYTNAMREIAEEQGLVLIDLNKKSLAYYNELGYEGTAAIFMQLKSGESPNYPDGLDDNTHFKKAGALQMARFVAEEINKKIPALAPFIKEMDKPDSY